MVLIRDYSFEHDMDDYEEEKMYLQAVSISINHLGKWCLSLATIKDGKDPFPDPNTHQYFSHVQ